MSLQFRQTFTEAHYDAINIVFAQSPEIEAAILPGVDNCALRWPKSIRRMVWEPPESLITPERTQQTEWVEVTAPDGRTTNRLVFKETQETAPLSLWDDPDLIVSTRGTLSPRSNPWVASETLQARGKSV